MKRKIYSILGNYYHKHDLIFRSLREAAKELDNEIEICDIGVEEFSLILKNKPELIIMNCENRINPQDKLVDNWMAPEIEKAIVNYVSEGGGLLAWHAGLASYSETGDYVKMLKGYFKFHPAKNKPVRYYTVGSDMSSGELYMDFEVIDEHYFVECDEGNTEVFMLSESADGNSIAGWKHKFGKGRVCCITPSHREEGLLHPDMLKLLRNSIDWCLSE